MPRVRALPESGHPPLPQAYWSIPDQALLHALGCSASGLRSDDVAQRQARYGGNTVGDTGAAGPWRLLGRQFASPLVLILVFGAGVALVTADWVDAAIILAIVAGSALIGFAQEYRASRAVDRLRARLAMRARVWRDGEVRTIPASELVPGDVIELAAGNLIPADGVLLTAQDFLVAEAALTGESLPVEKRPGVVAADAAVAHRTNCAFMGSSVRSGTARMLIVATGRATLFGDVAARLQRHRSEPSFARGVREFGALLVRIMVLIVLFVLTVNQLLGRPVIDSLLFAVALAVGISPELLPAIMSITLARGARAMAERGVIVRRLEALEDLGTMDVLCTDKTGTLTAGTVTLSAAQGPDGETCAEVLRLGCLNALFETGIENPIDAALVEAGRQAGLTTAGFTKVDEIPYDFVRKRLTVVVSDASDPGRHLVVTKGAFDQVLTVCDSLQIAGQQVALSAAERDSLRQRFRDKGLEGYRVIALASRSLPARERYGREDEAGMTFRGFLLFSDPPRPQAAQAVQTLRARGIHVKIVTGDNRYVAGHVAGMIGLDREAMLTGDEIARMRDESLWHRAERTDLFVEVDPQQKERIVRALQRTGHAVGFLGDGINDAPALYAADVGISVDSAVDVARESADIVLLRAGLDVLRLGIDGGRATFANTLKYIAITSSANFGNMVSMAVVTPLLPFLPLSAKQILLNNFLSDLPSIALSTDRVDPEQTVAPQRWDLRDLRRFMVVFGLISSVFDLVTFVLLLNVFAAEEPVFQTAWFVVSLLTELAVVLLLRTRRAALRSTPAPVLLWSTALVAALAVALPYVEPVAALFGFTPLQGRLALVMSLIVLGYVLATELAKRRFFAGPPSRAHGASDSARSA